uniref:Uncharacterized protein n=1 Tax=Pyramimonas obovata TaxID=1411642 RepID=A0A7S0WJF4_9CHLO|mmetsp:Transcript_27374/g.59818  ORF Transcript_27374/g.59818 Transcript_27374/m.59818 type:complete len:651 (+) Transcript_27374:985-2937(+)
MLDQTRERRRARFSEAHAKAYASHPTQGMPRRAKAQKRSYSAPRAPPPLEEMEEAVGMEGWEGFTECHCVDGTTVLMQAVGVTREAVRRRVVEAEAWPPLRRAPSLASPCPGPPLAEDAAAADGGGALYEAACALKEIVAGFPGAVLLVRARADIAGAAGADGVVLAPGSLPAAVARRTMQASAESAAPRLVAKCVASVAAAKQAEKEGIEILLLDGVDAKVADEILGLGLAAPALAGTFAHNEVTGWATTAGAPLSGFLDAGVDGAVVELDGAPIEQIASLKARLSGTPPPAVVADEPPPRASPAAAASTSNMADRAAVEAKIDEAVAAVKEEHARKIEDLKATHAHQLRAAESAGGMMLEAGQSEMQELVRKTNLAYNEMLAERMRKEDDMQAEIERAKRMLKSKESLEGESGALSNRCMELEHELATLRESVNQERERDAYLTEAKWKDQVETLTAQLKKASLKWKQLETAQGGQTELLQKMKNLDEQLKAEKLAVAEAKAECERAKKDQTGASKDKLKMVDEIAALTKQVTSLQTKVKEQEGGAAAETERLKKDLEDAKSATKTKAAKLTATERDLEKSKRQLDTYEAEKAKRAEEAAAKDEQIENLKRQLLDASGGGKTELKMLKMELETARKNLSEQATAHKGQ